MGRLYRALALVAVFATFAIVPAACNGAVAIINVDGTWTMVLEQNYCPFPFGMFRGGQSNQQSFTVNQNGSDLFANFTDQGGNEANMVGYMQGGRFCGEWTYFSGQQLAGNGFNAGREIRLKSFGNYTDRVNPAQIDGYFVVQYDNQYGEDCYSDQFPFWTTIGGGIPQIPDGQAFRYTDDEDFGQGDAVNLVSGDGTLRLSEATSTFPFIWISLSARNTICKINVNTGEVLGEYRSGPDGRRTDPSRTTVVQDGSCWAGNRQDGSVIHVALVEANQGVDRNNNGIIDTSTGYDDVLPWPNNVGGDGSAEDATDEAILHYTQTTASCTRHVSPDRDGNIWVSGAFCQDDGVFDKIDGQTGAVLETIDPTPEDEAGGYGGLIDGNNVLWSCSSYASKVLRWDLDQPLSGTNPKIINIPNYGAGVDPTTGEIWISNRSSTTIRRLSPDGNTVDVFNHLDNDTQGLAVAGDGHVWASSSFGDSAVMHHLLTDGTQIGSIIGTGNGSTGIAIDTNGKPWSADITSSTASRVDPDSGPIGMDGITPLGAVDLTVQLPGASPYNYSDMTGSVALGTTSVQGSFRVVQDGGQPGRAWGTITWNTEAQGNVPPGAVIVVEVRAADSLAALGSQSFIGVGDGVAFNLIGQYLEVRATLKANENGDSPILSDLNIFPTDDT